MENMVVESKKLYNPVISEILSVEQLTETEKRFEILLPGGQPLGHKPGQFYA